MLESSGQLPFLQAIIIPENKESKISIPHSLSFNRKGCSPPRSLCRSTLAFLSQNICHKGLNVLRWRWKSCVCMIHYFINAKKSERAKLTSWLPYSTYLYFHFDLGWPISGIPDLGWPISGILDLVLVHSKKLLKKCHFLAFFPLL